MSRIYDYKAIMSNGQVLDFSQFRGKVLLIVNTASKCGFTPQFAGLEELNQKYKDKGLVVIGFPCNQFAHQDPGTDSEISNFCQLNYGVTFQMNVDIGQLNRTGSQGTCPVRRDLGAILNALDAECHVRSPVDTG
ncbi:MAG: glutathione peroxidase, partial [Bacteroidales bacterium]|nr:glutathione peroxidase [Bacteroidales bacterium]